MSDPFEGCDCDERGFYCDTCLCRWAAIDREHAAMAEQDRERIAAVGKDGRVQLAAAQAEVVALRRVLETVLESAHPDPSNHPAMSRAWASAESALSSPSVAEPLLADIRAAVAAEETLRSTLASDALDDDAEVEAARENLSAALSGFRRWVK